MGLAIKTALKKIIRALGLDQSRCFCCRQPFFSEDGSKLCPDCASACAPYKGAACESCGHPFENEPALNAEKLCRYCQASRPPWDGLAYYGLFTGQLREMLLKLKFGAQLHLAVPLAEFLSRASKKLPQPDVMTIIPQHPEQLRKRGFNQANELAKALRKINGLPLDDMILERVKRSAPQEGLSRRERELNIAGSFRARSGLSGVRIWLVDDIMTSGATCREACASLREAGARKAYPLFVARTPLGGVE